MTTKIRSFKSDEVVFISDTHFSHDNIIKYCNRPFKNSMDMNPVLWEGMLEADRAGKTIIHTGDFIFHHNVTIIPEFKNKDKHIIVLGNHDKPEWIKRYYPKVFGTILGTTDTWRTHAFQIVVDSTPILLSHEPQQQLKGCGYNIYGHHHNNMFKDPSYFMREYEWVFDSSQHLNVSVELTNYKPVSFQEAIQIPKPKKPV
jgi:calcineurin-like phosphoesterase family protein